MKIIVQIDAFCPKVLNVIAGTVSTTYENTGYFVTIG